MYIYIIEQRSVQVKQLKGVVKVFFFYSDDLSHKKFYSVKAFDTNW